MATKLVMIFAITTMVAACSGGDDGAGNPPKTVSISGAVQKGPFIIGTPVFVNRLDEFGNASESTLITEIEDSVGSYSFTIDGIGPVQIISNGYYFSELTGQISNGWYL